MAVHGPLVDPLIARPVPRRWRSRPALLVAVLTVLNLLDLVTTRLVLDRGGNEGNPLMEPVVTDFWGALALKAVFLAVIALLAVRCIRSTRAQLALLLVNSWYFVVVGWNAAVLLHL